MRIQLAYRATGEDREKLIQFLKDVKGALEASGHAVWVPALDPDRPSSTRELFDKTFGKINECDVLLVIITSDAKSEGMLMETGYAIAKGKSLCLAIRNDVKGTHLRDLADEVIEFSGNDDLFTKLHDFKV